MYNKFIFNDIIIGYPNKSLISDFIDDNEDSVSNVINQIKHGCYTFKHNYLFTIIFSKSYGKYFVISQKYKYIYLCKKYMKNLVISNNQYKISDQLCIEYTPEEKLMFISSGMNNVIDRDIYTYMKTKDEEYDSNENVYFDLTKNNALIVNNKDNKTFIMNNPRVYDVMDIMIENNNQYFPFVKLKIINNFYNTILYISTDLENIKKIENYDKPLYNIIKYNDEIPPNYEYFNIIDGHIKINWFDYKNKYISYINAINNYLKIEILNKY